MAGPEAPITLCGSAPGDAVLPPGGLLERLLAALVLAGGAGMRRDELVEILWPERPPTDPGRALSPMLSRLRQAVGPVEGRGVVRLGGGGGPIDLRDALELLAAATRDEVAAPAKAHAGALAAAAILAGPLLPEHTDPWSTESRLLLAGQRARALGVAARAGLLCGGQALDAACAAAVGLVAGDPLREPAVELLMQVHVARGEEVLALQAYEALRGRLREELGTVPGRRLRERHAAVLARADFDAGPALPGALEHLRRSPLAGRRQELETLEAALSGPAATALTVVTGAPGIGKTRLVAEAAARAATTGTAVLFGRCRSTPGAPFAPIVEALRTLVLAAEPASLEHELGDLLPELGRLVPALHRRLQPAPVAVGGDPDTRRLRQFEAVVALLGLVTARRPVLLVLDDGQWLDGSTSQLVDHLLRSALADLTIVLTLRRGVAGTPEAVRALREAAGPRATAALALGPLSLDGLADLVGDRRPGLTAGHRAQVAADLLARTGGSPLFAQAALATGGAAFTGLEDTVATALDDAGAEVRDLVELLAVDGGRAELDVLAAACATSLDRVAQLADHAHASGLVDAGPGVGTIHDAVREATLGGLGTARRAVLHGRLAAAYEQVHADDPDVVIAALAEHWAGADGRATSERAAHYSERAARQALAALAYEQAAGHAREAGVQQAYAGGDDARRVELLLLEADALNRASALVAARRPLAEALVLARRIGRRDLVARAAIEHGGHRISPGLTDDVLRAALEAGLEAVPPEDLALRARLAGRLAAALTQGPADRRAVLAREAVELARASGDARALAETLLWAHADRLCDADPGARAALVDEARAVALEHGDVELALHTRLLRFGDELEAGRIDAARAEWSVWRAEGESVAYHRWAAAVCRPTLDMLDGDLGAAGRHLADAAGAAAILGADPVVVAGQQSQSMMMMLFAGQADVAAAAITAVIAEHGGGPAWRAALAATAAVSGDHAAAREQIALTVADGIDALADPNRVTLLSFLALAAAVAGARPAELRAIRDALAPRPDGLVVQHYGAAVHGAVAVRLALCEIGLADVEAARGWMTRADRVLGPHPPAMLRIDRDHAEVRLLRASGQAGRAATLATDAGARAAALGLAGYGRLLADALL